MSGCTYPPAWHGIPFPIRVPRIEHHSPHTDVSCEKVGWFRVWANRGFARGPTGMVVLDLLPTPTPYRPRLPAGFQPPVPTFDVMVVRLAPPVTHFNVSTQRSPAPAVSTFLSPPHRRAWLSRVRRLEPTVLRRLRDGPCPPLAAPRCASRHAPAPAVSSPPVSAGLRRASNHPATQPPCLHRVCLKDTAPRPPSRVPPAPAASCRASRTHARVSSPPASTASCLKTRPRARHLESPRASASRRASEPAPAVSSPRPRPRLPQGHAPRRRLESPAPAGLAMPQEPPRHLQPPTRARHLESPPPLPARAVPQEPRRHLQPPTLLPLMPSCTPHTASYACAPLAASGMQGQ